MPASDPVTAVGSAVAETAAIIGEEVKARNTDGMVTNTQAERLQANSDAVIAAIKSGDIETLRRLIA